MPTVRCDVLVVGGGPAGAATAVALRRHGLSVTIFDRPSATDTRIGETVPAEIRASLERLGAWAAFREQGHLPSTGGASAWGSAEPLVSGAGGWHLDRARFDALLRQTAERSGAEFHLSVRRLRIHSGARGEWAVRSGRELQILADFLVDATGRSASIAGRLGAARLCHDRLVSAFALLTPAEPPAARSLVETVEDGWWYATPVPGGRALAALFTDSALCRQRGYAAAGGWHDALRRTTHVFAALGGPPPPSRIHLAASTPHCLDRPAGVDWLAVGDSASSYDPLASSGLTLALRTGEEAAAAIVARRAGDQEAPARYGRVVQHRFVGYAAERQAFYALEQRWPTAPFWSQRSAPAPASSLLRREPTP